jgi:hypothetical protein
LSPSMQVLGVLRLAPQPAASTLVARNQQAFHRVVVISNLPAMRLLPRPELR